MPPDDAVVQPSEQQIHTLVTLLEREFARADAAMKPDPGRVTARRLNRAEYTNTIRDLLAVEFRADRNFPTDDSGDGFDNIADVLTVSPVLMEKYLSAAGRIAERAIATGTLPKPVEFEYSLRFKNLRRIDPSNVEATHRFDFDADYELKVGLPGQRALPTSSSSCCSRSSGSSFRAPTGDAITMRATALVATKRRRKRGPYESSHRML